MIVVIIKENFCLAPFNTFGIEVLAYNLSIITNISNLEQLHKAGKLKGRVLVLSKGSNILFTKNFDGLVLLNQMWGKEIIKETAQYIYLKVNAGEFWPSLVEYAVENGWGGLENMTDIPGKVGAAPIQNIGAYGAEIKDVMDSLEAFNLDSGEVETFSNKDCKFSYRTSIFKTEFKHKYFITSVTFKLSKQHSLNISYKPLFEAFRDKNIDDITIADVSSEVAKIRASKLPNPDNLKNAGSFFKNPVVSKDKFNEIKLSYPDIPNYPLVNGDYKVPAAWLIEQCGWKGKRQGNIGVHEKQALVIVKYGKASGNEIKQLADSIKNSISKKFNIELEMEVNIL